MYKPVFWPGDALAIVNAPIKSRRDPARITSWTNNRCQQTVHGILMKIKQSYSSISTANMAKALHWSLVCVIATDALLCTIINNNASMLSSHAPAGRAVTHPVASQLLANGAEPPHCKLISNYVYLPTN